MSQKCIHVVKLNILFSLKFEWYSDAFELKFKNIFFKVCLDTLWKQVDACLSEYQQRLQFHLISSLCSNFFSMIGAHCDLFSDMVMVEEIAEEEMVEFG